jgi:hypothetical protein
MTTKQERDKRLLDQIGTYLYGERWQSTLAEHLKLNPRTVRGWLEGRSNILPPVWEQIAVLVEKKVSRGPDVAEQMKKKLATLEAA